MLLYISAEGYIVKACEEMGMKFHMLFLYL